MPDSQHGRSDALQVMAWFMISCEVFIVASRLVIKKMVVGDYGYDDLLAILALISSILSGTAAAVAARAGLGQSDNAAPTTYNPVLLQKWSYVAEIFHVLCEVTIRLSILLLVKRIYATRVKLRYMTVALSAVCFWGLSSTLVVVLQCRLPGVWHLARGICLNMSAFWRCFSAIEIVIDLAIIIIPSVVSWQLQMSVKRKAVVMACFSPWITAIAMAGASIAYAGGFETVATAPAGQVGQSLWEWFLCSQILRATTILAACVPYLRTLIEAFPSGLLQTDEIRRRGLSQSDVLHGFSTTESEKSGGTIYYVHDSGTRSIQRGVWPSTGRRESGVTRTPSLWKNRKPTLN